MFSKCFRYLKKKSNIYLFDLNDSTTCWIIDNPVSSFHDRTQGDVTRNFAADIRVNAIDDEKYRVNTF